jgi:hypothetical protein
MGQAVLAGGNPSLIADVILVGMRVPLVECPAENQAAEVGTAGTAEAAETAEHGEAASA